MSIAIVFSQKDPQPWFDALKQHLPDVYIEVYPNIKDYQTVEFVLCWKPEEGLLSKFPNLKVIQSVGAGVDRIIQTQKIKPEQRITRMVTEQLANDMFEFLLASILGYLKDISIYQNQQLSKQWIPKDYRTIQDVEVCILGLGNIGSYVAKKLVALGFKVKGWASSEKYIENVKSYVGFEELDAALNDTDILINILPATIETENILNINNLKKLNKGAFLINVGRGEHLVEDDLLALLDNHLGGALLDVFRTEPLPENHPFWKHQKIQITPHIASITNVNSAVLVVADNYKNLVNSLPLKFEATLTKGY